MQSTTLKKIKIDFSTPSVTYCGILKLKSVNWVATIKYWCIWSFFIDVGICSSFGILLQHKFQECSAVVYKQPYNSDFSGYSSKASVFTNMNNHSTTTEKVCITKLCYFMHFESLYILTTTATISNVLTLWSTKQKYNLLHYSEAHKNQLSCCCILPQLVCLIFLC